MRLKAVGRAVVMSMISLSANAQPDATPSVSSASGNVVYTGADGQAIPLTSDGKNRQTALSPDGKTVAFIKLIASAGGGDDTSDRTALWLCNIADRQCKVALAPSEAADPKANLLGLSNPIFSLKGNFVYVTADAWATSGAIHQVDIATGTERFVADANGMKLVETGEYAGDLLVSQHRYYPAPQFGAHDQVNVIDPNGKVLVTVSEDEDPKRLEQWLGSNHAKLRNAPSP